MMRILFIVGLLVTLSSCLDDLIRIKITKPAGAPRIRKHLGKVERMKLDGYCYPHESGARRDERLGGPDEEPLKNQENLFWMGNVSIGEPAKTFLVNFDSGSAKFWVACECAKDDGNTCDGHANIFACNESSTCQMTTQEFCQAYGDGGYAYGTWFHDKVCIGDICTSEKQWVGCARETNEWTSEAATGDGLMGISYDHGQMKISAFREIFENPACNESVFAFYLDNQAGSENSELTLCGTDPNHYKGDLAWFDVGDTYFWWIPVTGFEVNGKEYKSEPAYFIDSGATDMAVPEDLYTAIQSTGCDRSKLPSITITIGGSHKFVISPDAYYPPGITDCTKIHLGQGGDVLGDSFLRSVYAAFDVKNGRIGLAQNRALHP